MVQLPTSAIETDSEDQDARSSFWRFAGPEYYTLAIITSVALATYIFVTGDAQSERLLTPALVATIMVANLVPAMTLIVVATIFKAAMLPVLHIQRVLRALARLGVGATR